MSLGMSLGMYVVCPLRTALSLRADFRSPYSTWSMPSTPQGKGGLSPKCIAFAVAADAAADAAIALHYRRKRRRARQSH